MGSPLPYVPLYSKRYSELLEGSGAGQALFVQGAVYYKRGVCMRLTEVLVLPERWHNGVCGWHDGV